jgi:2-oxoglutarate ferredoxin oxidoreductase subunit alpha
VLLFPQDPHECFEHSAAALDLADRLQTPVFVMTDLDIGMNQRLCEPFAWDDERRFDRGKIMTAEMLEAGRDFGRYKDVDGDGIPWRTLPGNLHPASAWFGRGTGHDENARYTEGNREWEENMARLKKKYDTARTLVPAPVIEAALDTEVGVIAYGSTVPAVEEARALLEQANGPKTAFLRLRALPCTREVHEFVQKYKRIYVVEANRDGQMRQILSAAMPDQAHRFRSACHSDGLPLTAKWVAEAILSQEVK